MTVSAKIIIFLKLIFLICIHLKISHNIKIINKIFIISPSFFQICCILFYNPLKISIPINIVITSSIKVEIERNKILVLLFPFLNTIIFKI